MHAQAFSRQIFSCEAHVFRRGQKLKVLKSVVALVAVKVMNVFGRFQSATDSLLYKPSVLQHPLAGLLMLYLPITGVFSLPTATYRQETRPSRLFKRSTKFLGYWRFVSRQALVVAFVLSVLVPARFYRQTATTTTNFDDRSLSFFHVPRVPHGTREHNAFQK